MSEGMPSESAKFARIDKDQRLETNLVDGRWEDRLDECIGLMNEAAEASAELENRPLALRRTNSQERRHRMNEAIADEMNQSNERYG
jgi:hypothetical protein